MGSLGVDGDAGGCADTGGTCFWSKSKRLIMTSCPALLFTAGMDSWNSDGPYSPEDKVLVWTKDESKKKSEGIWVRGKVVSQEGAMV